MSQIMQESNSDPLEIYHEWGRWRIVKCVHHDVKKNTDIYQYALQRYSDNKRLGRVWHLCCFFWTIQDLEEFIEELDNGLESIEKKDSEENILRR